MRAALMTVLAVGCGAAAPPPTTNPAHVVGECGEAPEGRRSLAARLSTERGEATVSIDGAERSGCALYDLPPGPHQVVLTARGPAGFGLHARMWVLDPPNRYDLFDLSCGLPGSCDTETLRSWRRDVEADHSRMTDPCGAAKVTGVKWESEQLDELHPKALKVSFTLRVYSKASGLAPRDPACPDR